MAKKKPVKQKGNTYEIRAAGESEAELLVYGDIGESWWGESVEAKDTAEQLSALDVETITVRINSYGGSVSDGVAIFNALRYHPAAINVRIDGVAVSIASLIAMAGDTVEMAENALFMVHAPWGGLAGNSKEMREYADVLDTYAKAMSSSYMRKTGQSSETIMDLLTDGEDHWYTAEEAVDFGFVDEIIEEQMAVAAGFDKSRFIGSKLNASAPKLNALPEDFKPAAVVAITQPPKEKTMTKKVKKTVATSADPAVPVVSEPVTDPVVEPKARSEAEVLAANRARVSSIRSSFSLHMGREGVQALLDKCIDDDNIDPSAASDKLLAHLGKGAEPLATNPKAEVIEDESDKQINAAMDVLIVRAGAQNMRGNNIQPLAIDLSGNPYRGSTLMDLAKASIKRAGKNPNGMDKREVVATAFQTTSDFPVLLENTIHKILLQAYMTAPDTWSRFCKIGSVSDFRAHNRYRVGSIGNLDTLGQHGELKTKTIPDGEKGSITATTKGNIIAITREAIINDDLQALTDLAQMFGRAYRRTIEAAVYSLLAENSGLGPTMGDGDTLFHANHGNIGTGAAIAMAAIDADRVLMAKQTDVSGNDFLDIRPAGLLLPVGLGGTARSINDAQYDPDTSNKLQKPNTVRGLFSDIIDTPRLTGTRRYMFADPNDAPVIEVAFLDGIQEPYIETKDGWSVDGAELKVRGDFGVGAIDYRGAVTNAGA